MTHSEDEKRRLTSIDNRLNVYFHNRADKPADNVKKLLDAVIDEGKFYFESVLFDIVKKIVALEEMLEFLVLWKWDGCA